jgi:hypothetical protein
VVVVTGETHVSGSNARAAHEELVVVLTAGAGVASLDTVHRLRAIPGSGLTDTCYAKFCSFSLP